MKLLFDADLLFPDGKLNSRLIPLIKLLNKHFSLYLCSHHHSFKNLTNEFSRHMSGTPLSDYFKFEQASFQKKDKNEFLYLSQGTIGDDTQKAILDFISMNTPDIISISLAPELQNLSIDTVLKKLKPVTSSERKKIIASRRVADSHKIFTSKNDQVSGRNIYILKQDENETYKGNMKILKKTDSFIYIEKSAHLPCMPLRIGDTKTLLHLIRLELPNDDFIQSCEDPFLYRLDNNTSGLIIAARSKKQLEYGRTELHSNRASKPGKAHKEYLAIVRGKMETPLTISTGLENRGKKVVVIDADKKVYTTNATPLCNNDEYSLVLISIQKGMRHQIRVHLGHSGFPIVGDFLYGFNGDSKIKRHYLHCYKIITPLESIEIPGSPPDDDFLRMLESIRLNFTFS